MHLVNSAVATCSTISSLAYVGLLPTTSPEIVYYPGHADAAFVRREFLDLTTNPIWVRRGQMDVKFAICMIKKLSILTQPFA